MQAVFHGSLALGSVAEGIGHADHFCWLSQLVALCIQSFQAVSSQETVVALGAHGVAREQVHRSDDRCFPFQSCLGVLTDQFACLVVVGSEQGISTVHWAVERDHLHALGLNFLDGGDNCITRRRDQNGLCTS